jgi:hypothetical protein
MIGMSGEVILIKVSDGIGQVANNLAYLSHARTDMIKPSRNLLNGRILGSKTAQVLIFDRSEDLTITMIAAFA